MGLDSVSLDVWVSHWGFTTVAPAKASKEHKSRHLPIRKALDQTYVQVNNRSKKTMFVFDFDDSDSDFILKMKIFDDESIPVPNWVTSNPETGNSHVGYFLETPITTTTSARIKPVHYGEAVYEGLREAIGADPGYAGFLTRSPGSHPTQWLRQEPYSLKELSEKITLPSSRKGRKTSHAMGLGRNCELFDGVRNWSYSQRHKFYRYQPWQSHVQHFADNYSLKFYDNPLAQPEINAVARSVSRWTWTNMDSNSFSVKQSMRSRVKAPPPKVIEAPAKSARSQNAAELRNAVVSLFNCSKTAAEIAIELGITEKKVYNQLAYARKLEREAESSKHLTNG